MTQTEIEQLTAKEQVLKVYPDAKKHYSIRLAEWAIIAGNKHKSFAFISDFTFTEQKAWESALAIINAKKEMKCKQQRRL